MSSEDDNKNKHDNKIKQLNDTLYKLKSFEEQLKSLKKQEIQKSIGIPTIMVTMS